MTDTFSSPGDTVKNYLTSIRGGQDEDQITIETIEAAEDINDAFDLADSLGVDMRGLNDLIEMKRRLIMHIECQDKSNYIEQVQTQLIEKSKEDEKKRKKLIEFLKTCKESMRSFRKLSDSGNVRDKGISTIGDILAVEGKPWNLDMELSKKIAEIEKGGCVFLVSGETNAGKSSFLNLLLDSNDILTVKAVSCTAVCTRIMYSEKTRVEILRKDGVVEKVKIDNRQPLVDQIEKLLFDADREQATSVFEVRLFMPIAVLKGGLVLVDTPGIGENHTMNNITEEFIANSKTDGFIYIIKSDNAGGVQEDQLGELLKLIIQKEKEKAGRGEIPLDKKCTMFVCNHWDNTTEQDLVYENALQRLRTYFPMLNEEQVIRFSTKIAKEELSINRNYVTPDFKDILNRLRDMYFSATDNKVIATYKWMESILKKLTRHLRTIVQRTDESEDELEEKMRDAAMRLDNLETKTDEILETLIQKVNSAKEDIYQQFNSYLSTPHAKTRIINWIPSELPCLENLSSWPEIKIELYERTSKRISNELAVWEEDNGIISAIRDDIVQIIRDELNLLEQEVNDIDDDVHVETTSLSSSDNRRKSMLLEGRVSLSTLTALQMNNDLQMSVIAKHLHPIGNVFRGIVSGDRNRLREYKEKPCKLAKEKTEKFLKYLLNTPQGNDHLRTFISNLLEKPMELIRATKENVPSMITADRKLMQHIMHCKHDTRESRDAYEQMMEGLEDLKHRLLEYGEGEIFVQDFKGNEIKVCDPKDGSIAKTLKLSDLTGNSSSEHTVETNVLRTLWTVLRNGVFSKSSDEDEDIFLRMYVMSSGLDQTCGEVSKLRFLRHNSVATLLGIHYFDGPLPAFVFRNHMKTLHQYFQRQRPKDVKHRILAEVIDGLEYLHRKKLVHMELNIHTITVDKTGSVKLTGACLPRKACLPLEKESIQVSYFVYLSPGILNGETYLACDDIYSLGLLIYELILNQKPFHRERKWTLDQFVREVCPSRMLGLEQHVTELPEVTRDLISRSVQTTADQRPIIQDFQYMVLNADEDAVSCNETRGRRRSSFEFYKR